MQTINVVTGFGYFTVNGKVVAKTQHPIGVHEVDYVGTYTEVANVTALSAVELQKYNADTLISWALQQVFAAELIPHMAAFLDFANKASVVSMGNFVAYATAVELTTTANTIIAKAIELGADLGGE